MAESAVIFRSLLCCEPQSPSPVLSLVLLLWSLRLLQIFLIFILLFLLAEKWRLDWGQTLFSSLVWAQVCPNRTKALSFTYSSQWNHAKKKPNLLKLLPQRLFPTKALVPLNIYSTIKLCLLFQLSTVYSSSLHHKEKGGVGSKTYEGCLTHPITRLLSVA